MWIQEKIHAPEVGRRWINSPGLTLESLRGRASLVDFWDYTCVNCLRTLPYLKEWDSRYRSLGLTVIGVHTPEFHFARTAEYVERAVRDLGVEYAVVLDNDRQIWQAYANRCWPAKYLIDAAGYVRYCHFGEGGYGETEEAIQKLLLEIDSKLSLPPVMAPLRDADRPGARCVPVTPELYLGFQRGRIGNKEGYEANTVREYQADRALSPEVPWLDGAWFAGSESVEACPVDGKPARLTLEFRAAEANLVMSPPDDGVGLVAVRLDGNPVSPELAGGDITSCDGQSLIAVKTPRMYRLVKSSQAETRSLELAFLTPGVAAYAFTFVSCCEPD